MKNLKNKVVLITGASSGIGRQLAIDLAKKGAKLILVARSEEKLMEVKGLIERSGAYAPAVWTIDVGDGERVEHVLPMLLEEMPPIDVLINNAGFGKFDAFVDADMKDIKAMFDVNVIGLMRFTSHVLPGMIDAGSGHVVNIASQAGKLATPKSSGYSASKHAVLGFSNSLRMEMKEHNIQVTTVNPGPIKTNFFETADSSGTYTKNVEKMMLSAEKVSREIISAIEKGTREVNLPGWMNAGAKLYHTAPGLVEKIAGKFFDQK
ncbi:SDR family NAD(P)-dependent oxidoreductase [Bacillus hwajinpoensis]|uniref:SDR family NAD(P)-dependent oxidoreductase n=1 Tax=Guptibacillus hwajinpoensis TaxID=208199 RepID=A0A845EXF4_9BACL|nr:SDR family oxidoreductase [Pseudalkalibacillus hwajinpoensis]MYL63217.1 SDR family NAD(P)-dependent oxidoreductase [Pseudalkalibacillus hwajinpoensis]